MPKIKRPTAIQRKTMKRTITPGVSLVRPKAKRWTPPKGRGTTVGGAPVGRLTEILQFDDVIGSLDDPGDMPSGGGGGGGGTGYIETIEETTKKNWIWIVAAIGGVFIFWRLRKK